MLRRLAAPVALLIAAAALSAQNGSTIKIEFGSEGEREVWMQSQGEAGSPPSKQSVSGKAVELDVPSDTEGVTVFVHDMASGNVAAKPLQSIVRTGNWMVLPTDETHAFRMTFRIEHEGLAVASAMVKLSGEGFERSQLLTPADSGSVSFFTVPYGDVQVTVEYKSGDISRSLPTQVFESRAGSAEQPAYVLNIADEVETVAGPTTDAGPAEGTEDEDDEEEEKPRTSPVATIINMAIGILAIGGISYMIWRYVKANPDQTAAALKKAGVHVPDDQAGTAMTTPKPAGPPQQIILGDAAPDPAQAGDAPPVAAVGPVAKNPRLVRADGSIFIVQEGVQTAGRDAGLELSLDGESSVSRTHAQITRTGDSVSVKDLGSTNGTYVNGTKIAAEVTLSPGDSVQFGAVQYRYEE
ncbi:MAG: FHA domain-containing protein [Armatimonadetes bacterium]|nr:FHA domain-containing protein [Armatimonadota bacterium]